jgi:ATP-dependent Lon protease
LEKIIAAHRAGIERVLLPKRNEKDLREVPEEVRAQLKFELMETAADVVQAALGLNIESIKVIREDDQRSPASPASA